MAIPSPSLSLHGLSFNLQNKTLLYQQIPNNRTWRVTLNQSLMKAQAIITTPNKHDVVIVGAGIAGLATALSLHRLGVESLVLEQADSLRTSGTSLTLFKNGWRVLDAIGVGNDLRTQFVEIQGMVIKAEDGRELRSFIFKDEDASQEVRAVERRILLETLASKLPRNCIRFSSKLAKIEKSETGETLLELMDGTQLSAKIVIGCDGIRSQVANWMGFLEPKYVGHCAFRGLGFYPNGHSYEPKVNYIYGRGLRAGYVPVSPTRVYWFICFNNPSQVEWDTIVPSKKRTCTGRSKAFSIEKLTKDLYTILHEQKSSHLSGSSEEDLLFESEAPMVSVEIGHGGVLIRHPSSIARDEESEASSLSVDNSILFPKNEDYSRFGNLSVLNESKGEIFYSAPVDKNKRPIQQEKMNREKPHHEIIQMLASSDSPLCSIDLKNVLNFEELIEHFTDEEQRQLVQYLPSVDISGSPDSLKNMFDSDQFKESVSSFQKLLAEGVFNKSLVGVKTEDCKTLKRHALYNLTKWQWVEHYNLFKKCKDNTQASAYEGPNISTSTKLGNVKRLRDDRNKNIPELRVTKTVKKKANYEDEVSVYNDNSCFSPRSLFRLPSENGSFMLHSYHLEEASDQDLLLDVPCSNSFPQAELVHEMSGNR